MDKKEADKILNRQKRFFKSGKTRSSSFRRTALLSLIASVKRHEKEIEDALFSDLGKSPFESYMTETGAFLAEAKAALRLVKGALKPQRVKTPLYLQPSKSFVMNEPYGSALIIGPFNYPLLLVLSPLIAAVSAGNCAVIAMSSSTPETAKTVKKIIEEVFPPEYVFCAECGKGVSSVLTENDFDFIFFTGSPETGAKIAVSAAKRHIPYALELGGKSPAVVGKTANIKDAARKIIWGKCLNSGATCIAPDYCLVHKSVREKLIREMKKCIYEFYGSRPENSIDYGRMVNEREFLRVSEILEKDKDMIVTGGGTDKKRLIVEPAILFLSNCEAECMKNELFAPVLPVLEYENESDILKITGRYKNPLAFYVFSRDIKWAKGLMRRIPFGGGAVNDCIMHAANHNMPFGGVGSSGMGRYHGQSGIEAFSYKKGIILKPDTDLFVKYPPYGNKKALLKILMR